MTCIKMAMEKAEVERGQLEAVGITNQRESTLVWNRCVACGVLLQSIEGESFL